MGYLFCFIEIILTLGLTLWMLRKIYTIDEFKIIGFNILFGLLAFAISISTEHLFDILILNKIGLDSTIYQISYNIFVALLEETLKVVSVILVYNVILRKVKLFSNQYFNNLNLFWCCAFILVSAFKISEDFFYVFVFDGDLYSGLLRLLTAGVHYLYSFLILHGIIHKKFRILYIALGFILHAVYDIFITSNLTLLNITVFTFGMISILFVIRLFYKEFEMIPTYINQKS